MGMRIGTWNVDARWDRRHERLVTGQVCDVWLLTETPSTLVVPGFRGRVTAGRMSRGQHWAAVFARDLVAADEPDVATAAAQVGEVTLWSSILPWPSCGPQAPWAGERHDDRVRTALRGLESRRPEGHLIWGGDWNHSLAGRVLGSRDGRESIIRFADDLGLQVPTAALPHRIAGVYCIDHIAVSAGWQVRSAERVSAQAGGRRLSDHDMYVLEIQTECL
jgi:endonuclease/exonuclease/phosphatase family metal-dependent hydrolase